MQALHIANTNFEFELKSSRSIPLKIALEQHPIFLQLQFLPLLYANAEDGVGVTELPPESFLSSHHSSAPLVKLDSPKPISCKEVVTWGPSPQIVTWATNKGISLHIPPWEVTRTVNSKAFSFVRSPSLPHAQLIHGQKELTHWLPKPPFPKVLKSCYGLSGKGKLIINQNNPPKDEQIQTFCHKEWNQNLPLIGEPWVQRFLDFSTQWEITQEGAIRFLGSTLMENDPYGAYQSTAAGPKELLFKSFTDFLETHKQYALPLLSEIQSLGFFGFVGIDAMVYHDSKDSNNLLLHPIVEINARQTMSLVTMLFQQKWYPNETIRLRHSNMLKNNNLLPLLPTSLKKSDGTQVSFSKQLYLEKKS